MPPARIPEVVEKDMINIKDFTNYMIAPRAAGMGTFDQRGQTCGIYALAAALKTYNIRIPRETAGETTYSFLYSPGDSMRHKAKHTHQETKRLLFFTKKKSTKLTKIGELFHTKDVVTLAKQYGHKAEVKRVKSHNFYTTIKSAIDNDKLVMIPFSPKDSGLPDPSGGTGNAHWCVAIGYLDKSPSHKILVTHWDMFLAFDAGECQSSNANLKNFKGAEYCKRKISGIDSYDDVNEWVAWLNTNEPKSPPWTIAELRKDPDYKVVTIPEAKLQRTLAKQIVII